jgi:hypothetical protein
LTNDYELSAIVLLNAGASECGDFWSAKASGGGGWGHEAVVFEGLSRDGGPGRMVANAGEQVIELDRREIIKAGLDSEKDGRSL